ncbi:MAG: MoxR family ATPase [Deltaproteobacteria bacterium]|nr:MoxR family ATPase [Deltaproteobacteria bacterium]
MAYEVSRRLSLTVGRVLSGKAEIVERAVITLLARGHLLIEDVPGVGKTTLARALARALGTDFRRVQCTSDLMPSEVLGVNVYNAGERRFEFRPGPVFTHILVADEINRATPKTQSALLEAMSERQVSIDGTTHPLKEPFAVIATQNPDDAAGTYPLPESQLDRFLLRTSVGYPSAAVEKQLLSTRGGSEPVEDVEPVVSLDELVAAQREVDRVQVEESVVDYLYAIVHATRSHESITVGVSTRGGLAFMRAARARAIVKGRAYVIPDDIMELAVPVLAHRVRVLGSDLGVGNGLGELRRDDAERILQEILARTDVPL